jgi:ectoine hydroxylase-related dioxygenase (phytanoyl-CoA dioxygenase family)
MHMEATAELDRLTLDLETEGICVLRGVFDGELMASWRLAFDQLATARQRRLGSVAARGANRFYLTLPWAEPFADECVFRNERVTAVLDRVLGSDYVMVQHAVDTALPGSQYQDLHRDHPPLFSDAFPTPLYALAVNFPLCRVTTENGPLEVVRGTHREPRDEALSTAGSARRPIEPVTLDLGDVVIRTPLAIHRGSPNRTREPRPMVVMGYVRSWLHTPNVDLTVPRGIYQSFSDEARSLLRCQIVDDLPKETTESYLRFAY